MPKRGRLSESELEWIQKNATQFTVDEISKRLDRTEKFVTDYLFKNGLAAKPAQANVDQVDDTKITVRTELRSSVKWTTLKQEMSTPELKFFEEEYVKLMSQFRSDVLASEENQIFDAIKFEVLKTRNMIGRRKALEDITRLEAMQQSFLDKFASPRDMSEEDKQYALSLETQLNVARSNEQSKTNEFVKLQERVDKLMSSLKATRDQRVAKVQDSKISFIGVLKMLQDRDVQEREGRQIGLTKLAADKEYERLGRPHRFEDGNEDSPILSADTVDLGPEVSEAQ